MSLPPESHALRSWLDLYVGHFAAHDRDWVRQERGGGKWTVHGLLTADVVHQAFTSGAFSVSGFMAHPEDRTTHVGAIDFDTADGLEQARRIRTTLADMGIGSMLVQSRRGAHLWAHAEGVILASVMRRALTNVLILEGLEDPKIEVFPKRSASPYGCGALRMPLMRHPGTGKRYPVIGADDRELTKVSEVIWLAVEQTSPPDALRALAGPEPMDTPYPPFNGVYGPLRGSGEDVSITSLLASIGLSARPGRSVRCAFHDDRHASLSVSADDERVWCKSPSCPLHGDGRGMGSRALQRLITEGATRDPAANAPGAPGP